VKPTVVEIHGHDPTDPTGTTASKIGFKVALQTTYRAGASGHESMQISAVDGGFYEYRCLTTGVTATTYVS
jgi:hypothetical protein